MPTAIIVLATALACIALHEGGHALAGWATGGRIAEFDILSLRPHVRLTGPATPYVNAVRATAGSLLLVATWFLAMTLVPRRRGVRVLQTVSCFAGMELAGWLLTALVHPWQPQRNDAAAFLNLTGSHPLAVFAACVAVAMAAKAMVQVRMREQSRQVFPAF